MFIHIMGKIMKMRSTDLTVQNIKNNKVRDQKHSLQPSHVHGKAVLNSLQNTLGNRVVQRLIAQRNGNTTPEVSTDTAGRIAQLRGRGQALDSFIQAKMGDALGHDFSPVRIHNSSESDELNNQLSAKAFTTGLDIFFRAGTYEPATTEGQELIAHELVHVIQQSSGAINSSEPLTVNEPNDIYEQEADSISSAIVKSPNVTPIYDNRTSDIQKQDDEENEFSRTQDANSAVDFSLSSTQMAGDIAQEMHFANNLSSTHLMNPKYGLRSMSSTASGLGSTPAKLLSGAGNAASGIGIALDAYELFESANNSDVLGEVQELSDITAGAASFAGPVGNAFSVGYAGGGYLDSLFATLTGSLGIADSLANQASLDSGEVRYGNRDINSGMSESHYGNDGIKLSELTSLRMLSRDQQMTTSLRELGILDNEKPAYTQTLGWQIAQASDAAGVAQDEIIDGTATGLLSTDQGMTNILRESGILDKDKPAHTQTLGWQIADAENNISQSASDLREDWTNLTERPGGFGATVDEAGEFIWEGADGKGGLKGVGQSISDTASDAWKGIEGIGESVGETASNAWEGAKDMGSSAGKTLEDAWEWLTD